MLSKDGKFHQGILRSEGFGLPRQKSFKNVQNKDVLNERKIPPGDTLRQKLWTSSAKILENTWNEDVSKNGKLTRGYSSVNILDLLWEKLCWINSTVFFSGMAEESSVKKFTPPTNLVFLVRVRTYHFLHGWRRPGNPFPFRIFWDFGNQFKIIWHFWGVQTYILA